jgi:hypothetical protein
LEEEDEIKCFSKEFSYEDNDLDHYLLKIKKRF